MTTRWQVPADIAALSELRILALDNNDLKAVPAAIGDLPHLRSLLLRFVSNCKCFRCRCNDPLLAPVNWRTRISTSCTFWGVISYELVFFLS